MQRHTRTLLFSLLIVLGTGLLAHDHGPASLDQLQLNDGEKWVANAATHQGMTAIAKLAGEEDPTSTELAGKLQGEINKIIQGCTMKGEAHEQLHQVLMPIIQIVNDLKQTEDGHERKHQLESLTKITTTYFAYFQAGS